MVSIIQISDFHVGSRGFYKKFLLRVIDYINEQRPDICVCTGDVTNRGRLPEFEKAKKLLDTIEVPLLCVPGNRDAKSNGLYFYERIFGPRIVKRVLADTTFLGLNSAISDHRDGNLGSFQLHWLATQLDTCETAFKVMVMHHHLIPVPDAGRERDTIYDAGDVLEMTQMFHVDLVLCGDRHVPYAWAIGPTTFISAGTTASNKVRGDEDPSFNEIEFTADSLKVHTVDSITFEKDLLVEQRDRHVVYIRHRKTRIEHLLNTTLYDPIE